MRQASGWLLVLLALGLTGCSQGRLPEPFAATSTPQATPAPGPATGARVIGALAVSGSAVFLNGIPVTRGTIHDGDRVTTGAASSALVELEGGGSVQIDENTDPLIHFQLLTEGLCLVVDIATGEFFFDAVKGDAGKGCICAKTEVDPEI